MTDAAPGGAPAGGSELRLRTLSALALAGTVLLATWWGGWVFRLIWALVAGIVAYEWLSMTGRRHAVAAGLVATAAGLLLGFSQASPAMLSGVAALAALIAAVLTPRLRDPLALDLCGVAYALVFAVVPPILRTLPDVGVAVIVWSFAVVWLTDIAAYFAGRRLGGPKLMPAVSPEKTWSGALGGMLAGTLGGWLVWRLTPDAGALIGQFSVVALSMAASMASQAGDLFESSLKRRFGAKDSSHLIPGHGGFLDRLDGYWAVLVLAGLFLVVAVLI